MTLSIKKNKKIQPFKTIKEVAEIKSKAKQLVAENEQTLATSELLLLHINSRENEILFI
ncbi:hypothetical protein [Flavobacterium sp.]|uniref:hypothetical protein n=1 Tax=Flavobacterium sp. TaxID=239 RepID=UPI002634FB01|nr:hypothetical protein [Flavobacterium sp.]